jgi:hypothetical protein
MRGKLSSIPDLAEIDEGFPEPTATREIEVSISKQIAKDGDDS